MTVINRSTPSREVRASPVLASQRRLSVSGVATKAIRSQRLSVAAISANAEVLDVLDVPGVPGVLKALGAPGVPRVLKAEAVMAVDAAEAAEIAALVVALPISATTKRWLAFRRSRLVASAVAQ